MKMLNTLPPAPAAHTHRNLHWATVFSTLASSYWHISTKQLKSITVKLGNSFQIEQITILRTFWIEQMSVHLYVLLKM